MTPSALSILIADVEKTAVNAILPLINLTMDPMERAVLWRAVPVRHKPGCYFVQVR